MRARIALTLAALALAPPPPRIQHLVRTFDRVGGFPVTYVGDLAQDRQGFLWMMSPSGLVRFDGTRAEVVFPEWVHLFRGSAESGRVLLSDRSGHTFEATPEGLVPLDATAPGVDVDDLFGAVDASGNPWRLRHGVLERLSGATWRKVPAPAAPHDPLRILFAGRRGRLYAVSRSGVWLLQAEAHPREIARLAGVGLVVERADGRVVAAARQGPGPATTRVFEIGGPTPRLLYEERGARLISMVERGDLLWVGMDRGLQGLGPGGEPRVRMTAPEIPGVGPLMVDREGSLWMGTMRGLVQIPDPEVWSVLPPSGFSIRSLARTEGGVWATFWGTLLRVEDGPGDPEVQVVPQPHFAGLCADGAGRVWTDLVVRGRHVVHLQPSGAAVPAGIPDQWDPQICGEGRAGRRWIPSGSDLWTVAPAEAAPRRIAPLPAEVATPEAAVEDAAGTLWVGAGGHVCHASAEDVLRNDGTAAWSCEPIPATGVEDLEPMRSGDVWVLTRSPGRLLRRAGGAWEPIPGTRSVAPHWPLRMEPSPAGGVWLIGCELLARVVERTDTEDGWEVVERPGIGQGVISNNVVALDEDADGTLWLGTDLGVLKMPPSLRRRRLDPPPVAVVETSVDGAPLDRARPVRLPFRRNRLEARFAALTFRDPAATVYRSRLRANDPWSAPSPSGQFQFVDLSPGRYALEVEASLDGERWSASPARLAFRVLRPWYAEPWFIGLAVLGASGSAHLVYRLRVRRRLLLERQRARIAMDLHDEVGSGLGTIAVLAGIAGRPDLGADRRADVAGRISGVSQELARSLGDIVWSLRASSGSLDALWTQLLDRARPLFASGTPRLTVEAPDPVPGEPLSLVVRRNLHLLALEALHNAARHANASTVVLRLSPAGPEWRLEVEDDGSGLAPEPEAAGVRRGLGLTAMRARAAEMGGAIAWEAAAGGGTRVVVRFRTGTG